VCVVGRGNLAEVADGGGRALSQGSDYRSEVYGRQKQIPLEVKTEWL
jgi:hypothetical protein